MGPTVSDGDTFLMTNSVHGLAGRHVPLSSLMVFKTLERAGNQRFVFVCRNVYNALQVNIVSLDSCTFSLLNDNVYILISMFTCNHPIREHPNNTPNVPN